MPAVDLGEITVAYTVRVSKRAKRISVRYSQRDGLEVVYPLGVTSPGPAELLQEKSAWVLATRERFRDAASRLPPRAYKDGETFLRAWPTVYAQAPDRSRKQARHGGYLRHFACAHAARKP